MRILTWTIRIALFILLLAFAARNTESVTLRFYFDLAWQAPLVVLLLAFFAAGAGGGLNGVRVLVAARAAAVLRPGLARGAHRHPASGLRVARAAALVLQ